MIYTVAALTALAQQCAPGVATEALVPLLVAESEGNPLAINVNNGPRVNASNLADAVALAKRYIARGHSVDIGLGQINSKNLARLGVSIEQTFDPCTNLGLASRVLQKGYAQASQRYSGLDAISVTYSLYNTGSMSRGFRNGYVKRVWAAAARVGAIQTPPALPDLSSSPSILASTPQEGSAIEAPEQWVFSQASTGIEVFQ